MLKKLISFVLMFMLICMLMGCSNSNLKSEEAILYDNNISVKNAEPIDNKLLEVLPHKQPYIFLRSYSSLIPIDVLDKSAVSATRFSNGRYYTVSKLSGKKYLFLMFDYDYVNNQTDIIDSFEATTLLDKECISNIKIGSSMDDVKTADPTAYIFENLYSVHRFSDKSVVEIHYKKDANGKHVVSEISQADTKDSVLSYLLPIDLDLITR